MSTAVAHPPITTSMEATTRAYATIQPSGSTSGTPNSRSASGNQLSNSPVSGGEGTVLRRMGNGKHSPTRNGAVPKVIVKKEPASPEITTRHRPRRLDLSVNMTSAPGLPTNGMESAGLALKDVGLACLSPGFQTHDPSMREQLQRSMDVREQQRLIIEARQKGQKEPSSALKNSLKTPGTSRRKGPPPGLSIAPPSHEQFANERVIQSAPINQTFTGLRQTIQPLTRHIANQPASLSHTSHIHHVPATQTNNRLPPITDVFASELNSAAPHTARPTFHHSPSSHSTHQVPLPSPGFPPTSNSHPHQLPHNQQLSQLPQSTRREFNSAEDAVQSMSGGREDLLPRIVHYGGHQPPTPPSPIPQKAHLGLSAPSAAAHSHPHPHASYNYERERDRPEMPHPSSTGSTSRRRTREEYERDMGTPPLGRGPEKRGAFGEGRDSPESVQRKKEEFLRLCDRAWDLFHS
ncbi:hypothetical protein P152DRAFT_490059 [Eremomyces bilateralis CBS 781.70]|uniref:Uncharacterized protein n=1 Tax=Eremomyces bilateralis CBS 781.70 TaxID=1392243 RepID=A0A6G1FYY7_9PEZI|nr:uncharacterized protein P152DRAFT_490059 [Eremomyces bilateralis CBS 781.70]KAF1810988.1 hypothetical protein P152DRAFT_490059 [Eremomyces bilateralis CBS 781.70]